VDIQYDFLQTDEQLERGLQYFLQAPLIAIDTETTGLDPHSDKILLIQMSDGNYTVVIDMKIRNSLSLKRTESNAWKLMVAVLTGTSVKVGHNIGFDFKMLRSAFGCNMSNMFCTMLAERILTSGKDLINKYPSLKSIVPKYTDVTEKDMKKEIREDFYMGYVLKEFTRDQLEYSARDVLVLLPIYYAQMQQLRLDNMMQVAALEFNIIEAISLMEYYGVNIDTVHWRQTMVEVEEERVKVRAEIQDYLQPLAKQKSLFADFCPISIDSPSQLLKALQDLGVEVESTGKNILDKIKGSHPVVKPLLKYRKMNKLITSFGETLLEKINPVTGRLHCNFKQIGADSGRMAALNPNLQQIPSDSKFRQGFIAPEGFKCISADYSAQELRVLAFLSNESNMLEAYWRGEDLHNKTTSLVYGIPMQVLSEVLDNLDKKKAENRFNEITKEEEDFKHKRGISKSTNFLCAYGGSYKRLADVANIPEKEAMYVIDTFFESYPALKKYIQNEGQKAIAKGYSETILGRRRYYNLPPTSDPDYGRIEAAIKRQAVNHTIQGASAEMTKLAVYYAHQKFINSFGNQDAYLCLSIHDEIVAMCKKGIEKEVESVLLGAMQQAFEYIIPPDIIPFKAESSIGEFWIH
jgi:DNA polymerase I